MHFEFFTARSVAAHEMGHALGLYDNTGSNNLMCHNRTRTTITTPQAGDIIGARAVSVAAGWARL